MGLGLMSAEFYDRETKNYCAHLNEYGLPLDSRADYTKSDWEIWSASMARDPEVFRRLIAPVDRYLRHTSTRVPFSDWYDTVTGRYVGFIARSVQGGVDKRSHPLTALQRVGKLLPKSGDLRVCKPHLGDIVPRPFPVRSRPERSSAPA